MLNDANINKSFRESLRNLKRKGLHHLTLYDIRFDFKKEGKNKTIKKIEKSVDKKRDA